MIVPITEMKRQRRGKVVFTRLSIHRLFHLSIDVSAPNAVTISGLQTQRIHVSCMYKSDRVREGIAKVPGETICQSL